MTGCAVIGAGAVAPSHIKGYLAFPGRCRLLAVADTRLERAKELCAELSVHPAVTSDYQEILDNPAVDLVSICTPPSTHLRIASACLRKGKHVLLEKPMALSLQECDALLEAAERYGRFLSVISQNRFFTPARRLKSLLDSGLAGRLLHAQVIAGFWRGESYYNLDWRGRWSTEGGGCTLIHAIHQLDLLLWYMGMPQSVFACMANLCHSNSEAEDISLAVFRYADGRLASATSSILHHGDQQSLLLQTEHAGLELPLRISCSKALENGFPVPDKERAEQLLSYCAAPPPLEHEGHAGQIGDMLDAVETGRKPMLDGTQGRDVIGLIHAVYLSAATGREVALPLHAGSGVYTHESLVAAMPVFHQKTVNVAGFTKNRITISGESKPPAEVSAACEI